MSDEIKKSKKEGEHDFLLNCIEVYRSLPALWKVKSDEYKDRDKKAQSWKEKYPNATEDDVKKKFNSMRTNFRTELKRVIKSKKSGAGSDSVYVSTKWFYNSFAQFLTDQEIPASSINTMEEENEDFFTDAYSVSATAEGTGNSTQEIPTEQAQQLPEQISQGVPTGPQQQPAIIPQNRKRKTDCVPQSKSDDLIDLVCSRLRKPVSDSDNDHIAVMWARELTKMEPHQQVYAKKFINDIIFEGQMGTLHRNSVIINQPAPSPRSYTSFSHSSNDQSRSSFQHGTPYNTFGHGSNSQQQQHLHISQVPQSTTNVPPVDLGFNKEDSESALLYEESRHAYLQNLI